MGMLENTIAYFAPVWAQKRDEARMRLSLSAQTRGIFSGGGAYTGASNNRTLKDWSTSSADVNSATLPDLPVLRDRSIHLYNNTATAHGAIKTINTNVIGTGLLVRSIPDTDVLGITQEEALEWAYKAEREFEQWAESPLSCDFARQLCFAEIQRVASIAQQLSGDVFVLMPHKPRKGTIYDLRLQLIDAARVSNPNDKPDDEKIAGGIEHDEDKVPIAIHIRTPHPGDNLTYAAPRWDRVELYGAKTGRRNVLHIMEHDRISQLRAAPILAPVIEQIRQISKYTEAELQAAVINAVLAVFVKRDAETDNIDSSIDDDDEEKPWERADNPQSLGSGTWIDGAPGEELQIVNSARPSNQFDPFFTASMKQIGMALELPYEILMKQFNSSYSAARAALMDAWKMFRARRKWLVNKLCQPTYEELITEAIIKGRIRAPGFFDDLTIRRAYLKTQWVGPTPGQLDPGKEYDAANKAVEYGFHTRTQATAELTGQDHDEVIKGLSREQALRERYGVTLNTGMFQPVATNDKQKTEEEI
ncbi:phage portal protein [Budviciaceae bacterium CWB-B4]|uniref:Phage portal protein n=1 Tax=Limnobaculum xujianqingii TaxID=2738837 RepID=A0A9D7AI81_9GAMM|nr:phage portal protein [Limnobaculum xujianqingii]MBK5073236.1 phage portal protein [Limnobaculum xujianqingii]MBK5176545.1 phage portal protein [Limnobaculum xujianqingii]